MYMTVSVVLEKAYNEIAVFVSDIMGLAPVVQRVDNAIHRINHYPVDSVVSFANTYPLDSDLSAG